MVINVRYLSKTYGCARGNLSERELIRYASCSNPFSAVIGVYQKHDPTVIGEAFVVDTKLAAEQKQQREQEAKENINSGVKDF